jgi:hypothetical protein
MLLYNVLRMRSIAFIFFTAIFVLACAKDTRKLSSGLSLNGFSQWHTGQDEGTIQLIPVAGSNALAIEEKVIVAHAKFKVKAYGEMSFPIDSRTPEGEEARRVDLGGNKFIVLTYRSNHQFILQLRQTAVHGGKHNHVVIEASPTFVTDSIYFSEFIGGLKPLDLADVAKFNFAFLSNNDRDGYAEIVVKSFEIR